MSFDWTEERHSEFDELIKFMIQRNSQDCSEKYGSSYVAREQEQFYYSDEDAWLDIQAIIKGEDTLYG